MADMRHSTDGPSPFAPEAFDEKQLPDWDREFYLEEHIQAFAAALSAPEPSPSSDDLLGMGSPTQQQSTASLRSKSSGLGRSASQQSIFITAQNDWAPVNAKKVGRSSVSVLGSASAPPIPHHTNSTTTTTNTATTTGSSTSAPSSATSPLSSSTNNYNNNKSTFASRRAGRRRKRALSNRTSDETREGYLYSLLKWPLLLIVGAWVVGLAASYLLTRLYIFLYEHFVAWRGRRERLRRRLQATTNYGDWVAAAQELDRFLGNERWKTVDEFAYYNSRTVRRVLAELRKARRAAAGDEQGGVGPKSDDKRNGNGNSNGNGNGAAAAATAAASLTDGVGAKPGHAVDKNAKLDNVHAIEELKALVEACTKNNFVGAESSRLYSQTYYGTKNLVQQFVDESEKAITLLNASEQLEAEEKRKLFKRLSANYGRSALCLSGGGSFAYYHFGVVKALLDADLLPDVITGTSGGALVAALVATRTNEELKQLLVPALATKINACSEPLSTWLPRFWRTGARFDSIEWARRCSWFTRGSMTFREAYERTGRILNVSCVPADPHSPTILTNYLTSPDCVIWSAVLASAAVPGILNPVVLMMKRRDGSLAPYSFGHKWKDGSLRTDIPLKALNLHFNVNFSIVSQVNPHINLFFFSSRGSVGQPVTHRRGRGWRGGFVGSATEQFIKLDLNKWLKVLRHLELLPRPMGQDWSEVWLQQFSGTITIWPRTVAADFWRILSDPSRAQLARMLHVGQQSCFPKLKFVANRAKVERAIERGRRQTRRDAWAAGRAAAGAAPGDRRGSIESIISEDDLRSLLLGGEPEAEPTSTTGTATEDDDDDDDNDDDDDDEEMYDDASDGSDFDIYADEKREDGVLKIAEQ